MYQWRATARLRTRSRRAVESGSFAAGHENPPKLSPTIAAGGPKSRRRWQATRSGRPARWANGGAAPNFAPAGESCGVVQPEGEGLGSAEIRWIRRSATCA
jgi:hypothetical protein